MKVILFFCANLLISNLVYAELSRKDLVSYTLDFYAKDTGERDEEVKKQRDDIAQQSRKMPPPEHFSDSQKPAPTQRAKKEGTRKVEKETMKKTVTAPQKNSKKYGTKLSFTKTPVKVEEKKISIQEKDVSAGKINEQELKIPVEGKPNRLKGVLKNVHPYIIVIGEANDNIYHTKGDTVYDFTTKLYPGFEFKSKKSQKNLDAYLNTGFEVLRYVKNHQHNHESPFASGFLRYNIGKVGFITSASAKRYRSTPSDLDYDEAKQFDDYWKYNMGQDFKFNFNRLEVDLQYNRSLISYEDDLLKTSNRIRDVVALRNSIKIFPKTKAFLEYAHGWLDYNKNESNNYTYDRPILGLNGQILRKLGGTIKIGYNFNKRKAQKDLNGTVFNSTLDYAASPRLSYYLNAVNGLGDVNLLSENITKYRGVSLGCSYIPSFLKRMRIKSNVAYWQLGTDQDKSGYWNVSFTPEYKLKEWLVFGLSYIFENRSSKLQERDYRNNRIGFIVMSEF